MSVDLTDDDIAKEREVDEGGLADDVPHSVESSAEHSEEIGQELELLERQVRGEG